MRTGSKVVVEARPRLERLRLEAMLREDWEAWRGESWLRGLQAIMLKMQLAVWADHALQRKAF